MPPGSPRQSGDLRASMGLRGSGLRPSQVPAQKTGPNRRLILTAALVLVALFAAAILLCRSSSASPIELTSARLVPDNSVLYVAINTDLDSSQWVSAFRLAEKFGADDPGQQLKDGATAADIDWDDDVRPFLGGDAAFFLRRLSGVDDGILDGGLVLRCSSPTRAMSALRDQASRAGISLERRPYGGGIYEADDASSTYVAVIGDHIVITMSERTLKDVVDTYRRDRASLAESPSFQAVRDGVVNNFLVFTYVDPSKLAGSDAELRDSLQSSGLFSSGDGAFGGVLTASTDVFSLEQAFPTVDGEFASMLSPREPSFASRVPGSTSLFVSTSNLAAVAKSAEATGAPPVDAAADVGALDVADLAWIFAGAPFELAQMDDLVNLLTGETAVASWPASEDALAGSVLIAEVQDEEAARQIAVDLAAGQSDHDSRATDTIAGVDVTVVGDGAVAVADGVLIAGSLDGVRVVLEGTETTLADSPVFSRAKTRLGAPLGSFVFLNVRSFITAFGAGEDLEDPITRALESVLFNGVAADGLTRFSAIVLASE